MASLVVMMLLWREEAPPRWSAGPLSSCCRGVVQVAGVGLILR